MQSKICLADVPISQVLINAWNEAIRICGLEMPLNFSDGVLTIQISPQIKKWVSKGMSSYYYVVHKAEFQCFETLKRKYDLCIDDFFRYLQVRNYFN